MKSWLKPGVIALTAVVALASTAVMANANDAAQSEQGCMMKGGKHAMSDVKGHHKGQMGDIRHMLRGLDLSDEQKAQVKELLQAHKESRKAKRDAADKAGVSAHHDKMLALMAAPTFDETAARALIAERQARGEERALASMKLRHQVYNLLTAEQKAQLKTMLDKKLAKRVERMESRAQQQAQ